MDRRRRSILRPRRRRRGRDRRRGARRGGDPRLGPDRRTRATRRRAPPERPRSAPAARPRPRGSDPPGIDVSHWQGDIHWPAVADDGVRFAFMKATDGTDYVDPTFASNRARARASGLEVGAYHFAKPDRLRRGRPPRGSALRRRGRSPDRATYCRCSTWRRAVASIRTASPRGRDPGSARFGASPASRRSSTPARTGWATGPATRRCCRGTARRCGLRTGACRRPRSPPTTGTDADGWCGNTRARATSGGSAATSTSTSSPGSGWASITIRRLSVDVSGGAGRVTSDPAGLGCAAACTRATDPDARVTLTAVPDDHAAFRGWTGACEGTDLTCTVSMRGNRAVGARFDTDITPPAVTVATPTGLTDAATIAFDEPVRGVGPGSVVLRTAAGGRLAVHRVCRIRRRLDGPMRRRLVRSVSLRPAAPLVPGRSTSCR